MKEEQLLPSYYQDAVKFYLFKNFLEMHERFQWGLLKFGYKTIYFVEHQTWFNSF